jgi:5-hydroxyisourate hydrolase
MKGITTHVLDTSRGLPAARLAVTLERIAPDGGPVVVGQGTTDSDGRARTLVPEGSDVTPGRYRLRFETGAWYAAQGVEGFYPQVIVEFELRDDARHCHVPLLLSPYGYSTYRGT